jgi:hypothetical protein
LAQQYNVFDILRPLLEIVPGEGSPPPAPKHITAAPVRNKKKLAEGLGNGRPGKGIPMLAAPAPIGTGYTLPAQQGPPVSMTPTLANMMMTRDPSSGQGAPETDPPRIPMDEENESFSRSPSEKSSSSRTPSPVAPAEHIMGSLHDHMQMQGIYGTAEEYALAGGNTLNTGMKRKAAEVDQGENASGGQPQASRQRLGPSGSGMAAGPASGVSAMFQQDFAHANHACIATTSRARTA